MRTCVLIINSARALYKNVDVLILFLNLWGASCVWDICIRVYIYIYLYLLCLITIKTYAIAEDTGIALTKYERRNGHNKFNQRNIYGE